MNCSLPGSSVHGILQARILEWVAIFSSGRSFQPRDWTQVSCIAGRLFTIWATREAPLRPHPCLSLEEKMATHSSILAWRIPWTEEPGKLQFSSVQFSHLVMSDSVTPWTAAPSFPVFPQLPGLANSCPLSLWCHPSTSSSFVPFSSCPQSFPSSRSFPMSQLRKYITLIATWKLRETQC